MKQKFTMSALVFSLAVANGVAMAEPGLNFAAGKLVDAKGMTLYTFDKDAADRSNCNGSCAAAWPPATVAAEDRTEGEFTVVTRDDGTRQWAYQGRPLYRFAGDANAGDANGDNKGNVWHVIEISRAAQGGTGGSTTRSGY